MDNVESQPLINILNHYLDQYVIMVSLITLAVIGYGNIWDV